MLRTILVQAGELSSSIKTKIQVPFHYCVGGPIYSACWSPDSDHVLYASGKTLVIKSLQSGMKPVQWPAHDGLILCADWTPANTFIVSGGEDRKYKVLEQAQF